MGQCIGISCQKCPWWKIYEPKPDPTKPDDGGKPDRCAICGDSLDDEKDKSRGACWNCWAEEISSGDAEQIDDEYFKIEPDDGGE